MCVCKCTRFFTPCQTRWLKPPPETHTDLSLVWPLHRTPIFDARDLREENHGRKRGEGARGSDETYYFFLNPPVTIPSLLSSFLPSRRIFYHFLPDCESLIKGWELRTILSWSPVEEGTSSTTQCDRVGKTPYPQDVSLACRPKQNRWWPEEASPTDYLESTDWSLGPDTSPRTQPTLLVGFIGRVGLLQEDGGCPGYRNERVNYSLDRRNKQREGVEFSLCGPVERDSFWSLSWLPCDHRPYLFPMETHFPSETHRDHWVGT